MTQEPHKPVRDQILENTLGAVRQKKNQRKRNKTTLALTSLLVAIAAIAFTWQKNLESDKSPSQQIALDLTDGTPPNQTASDEVQIDISEDGAIHTKSISFEELAKIVYNPNLEFSRTHDTFTWKGAYTIIHMHLPQTSMAITDTGDESL